MSKKTGGEGGGKNSWWRRLGKAWSKSLKILVPITSKNTPSGEVDEGFETDTFCSLHGSMGGEGKG